MGVKKKGESGAPKKKAILPERPGGLCKTGTPTIFGGGGVMEKRGMMERKKSVSIRG